MNPTPPPPAVSIQDLWVKLGDHAVLRGVSLEIPSGALVALIGPNGSGKTTLLRVILGLQSFEKGDVTLWGKSRTSAILRRVGYVPQKLELDRGFALTVREFLALRLPSTRHWLWRSSRAVDALLLPSVEGLGVEELLNRPITRLSGGQLQRVLISASLLPQPDLLLLDEPTAGVDTPGERSFYELIETVHQSRRLTVVLVSHDLSMVCRHASWVYALNGVLCCQGTPRDVMNDESLKRAYGLHLSPYDHHHTLTSHVH